MAQSPEQTESCPASALSPSAGEPPHLLPNDYPEKGFYKFHHHSLSDSTAYCSNDSSPTTTVSTVDDSSATEPSPGSSPESPPPSTFAANLLRPRTSGDSRGNFFELQKQPPARKGRNLKNLAVDTSRQNGRAASTTSLPLILPTAEPLPAIMSPAFVKPPSPPKRRPSNLGLTLQTPGTRVSPPGIKLAIPGTPGLSRPSTLRHFQSSPSLPVLPGFHSTSNPRLLPKHLGRLETVLSPIVATPVVQAVDEDEQNFDVPLSMEEKPEAYPEGPISVYAPYIDLYLEPTAEQCRAYDVIMNVASEVRNPLVHEEKADGTPDIRIDGGGGIQYAPRRGPLINPEDGTNSHVTEASPTTPKATPLCSTFPTNHVALNGSQAKKDPEYVHIPWEHNSDIVPDLLRLCKVIDERVQQHKRILVHCQCGVSRSASLVVAYGLYKDPSLSVQEAYDAVKTRSKWIGPNMNLIMQLQEFRSSLARGGQLSSTRGMTPITPSSAFTEWRSPFSAHLPERSTMVVPMSASVAENPHPFQILVNTPAATPGPSSAPSATKWPSGERTPDIPTRRTRAISAVKRTSAYVDTSGHLIPVLQVMKPPQEETNVLMLTASAPIEQHTEEQDSPTPTEPPLMSSKVAEFAMTRLQPAEEVAAADAFGIMSPTTTEFSSSPFDRSALLASLGMGALQPETPRRATSLRSAARPASSTNNTGLAPAPRTLRNKISAPSIREQRQLQDLQARIQSNFYMKSTCDMQNVLMSPRATEFTKNPFALASAIPEMPSAESESEGGTSRSLDSDPRSPAHAGGSPFNRSILDVL
ncbi:hypothetical protein LTR62_002137 [Meristemomyces frigidus]|uniref:protein-tyrosine-phosphatase n=1 Tax=Meristemomyces frigidus TaxID=1508187 RepID=A0AAN7TJD2_9PEZI|nr:hypothetical protein LTR62_002137 [Meristemomyces frigidus]